MEVQTLDICGAPYMEVWEICGLRVHISNSSIQTLLRAEGSNKCKQGSNGTKANALLYVCMYVCRHVTHKDRVGS